MRLIPTILAGSARHGGGSLLPGYTFVFDRANCLIYVLASNEDAEEGETATVVVSYVHDGQPATVEYSVSLSAEETTPISVAYDAGTAVNVQCDSDMFFASNISTLEEPAPVPGLESHLVSYTASPCKEGQLLNPGVAGTDPALPDATRPKIKLAGGAANVQLVNSMPEKLDLHNITGIHFSDESPWNIFYIFSLGTNIRHLIGSDTAIMCFYMIQDDTLETFTGVAPFTFVTEQEEDEDEPTYFVTAPNWREFRCTYVPSPENMGEVYQLMSCLISVGNLVHQERIAAEGTFYLSAELDESIKTIFNQAWEEFVAPVAPGWQLIYE